MVVGRGLPCMDTRWTEWHSWARLGKAMIPRNTTSYEWNWKGECIHSCIDSLSQHESCLLTPILWLQRMRIQNWSVSISISNIFKASNDPWSVNRNNTDRIQIGTPTNQSEFQSKSKQSINNSCGDDTVCTQESDSQKISDLSRSNARALY